MQRSFIFEFASQAQQPTPRRTAATPAQRPRSCPTRDSPSTTMIYSTAIFRTVIALSTVAATTQATVAGPHPSTQGSKRGKSTARYIDTAADLYEASVLNVASPNSYVKAAVNTKTGVNLRTITSPDATGGTFSYASPINSAGAVTLIKQSDATNTYVVQSPRTDKGVKSTSSYGTNVGGHTNVKKGGPYSGHSKKRGEQGGYSTNVGVGIGTILDVLNGYGATGQQSGYSQNDRVVHDTYGNNGATGGERSSYGNSDHGVKKGGRGKQDSKKIGTGAYMPMPPSMERNPNVPASATLNPSSGYGGNNGNNIGGNGGNGSNGSPKNSNSGSVGGSQAVTEAPVPSSTGSGYGYGSGSATQGQSSKSGSGSNKGGNGSNKGGNGGNGSNG
ncbi:hypothetical protein F442_19670, partial [Phytophthora nicotianae P10297]